MKSERVRMRVEVETCKTGIMRSLLRSILEGSGFAREELLNIESSVERVIFEILAFIEDDLEAGEIDGDG